MVDFDPSIINKVFETTDPVPVSREKIAKFCETISEANPIFTDDEAAKKGPYGGIIAPPGFGRRSQRAAFLREGSPLRTPGLRCGQGCGIRRADSPGDEITLSSSVKEIYDKTGRTGTMVFVVIRSTLRNQKGEVVAHVDHRFMSRT